MNQENTTKNEITGSRTATDKPVRKGLHRIFHVSRLDVYISAVAAMVFAIFGVIELFNITELSFIRMSNSFMFSLLFGIFGMVSRIYYKLFEEQYDRK